MTSSLLMVFSSATEGHDNEFRNWYDNMHIPELQAAFAEIESVERFDLAQSVPSQAQTSPARSLAVYHVVGSSRDLWSRIMAKKDLGRSDAMDRRSVRVIFGRNRPLRRLQAETHPLLIHIYEPTKLKRKPDG